ncbi:hypothetical protein [Moosepox virus GoldyGopher14]|nr:hypothetical protein [Moosepox virus GoldyGopher14]
MEKSAAIITSLISLFDVSLEYQTKICLDYCKSLNINNYIILKEFGYICDNILSLPRWETIMNEKKISLLIFYQVKQLSISVEKVYNKFIEFNNINDFKIYFVKDNLLFDGYPPTFKMLNKDINILNKKKLMDLITIVNMKTLDTKMVSDFINNNFGNVEKLLNIINLNSLWFKRVINKNKKKGNRANKRYKSFINKIKNINKLEKSFIDNICNDFNLISI